MRRSFERQASLFVGADSPFAPRPSSTLSWIEPLAADMVVLDVACGAAHASEPVAHAVHRLIGIDLTPALLRIGAERLRQAGVSNVLLQVGDAQALPFVDESFDVVFCRSSLHHFADPARAVEQMRGVCRCGGRVVLVDLIAPDVQTRELFDHIHRLLDPSHVRTFTEVELTELIPGGFAELSYANTANIRLPIDVAITEQSDGEQVRSLLRAELDGTGEVTGFEPDDIDGSIVVSFTTSIIHALKL
ncbi:MAG TPA: methyltransferase domain-containing protein [Acidimicrobiia bacterium]|nr:methyltransferase domain-containing protein [Acidimicrobiia bacterium]